MCRRTQYSNRRDYRNMSDFLRMLSAAGGLFLMPGSGWLTRKSYRARHG
jgi:hypothetical protein